MESLDGDLTHAEHFPITKDDSSMSLVESPIKDIGDSGTEFVWEKSFEVCRNKELAEIHPEHANFLKS
jgi:hypothetical protein